MITIDGAEQLRQAVGRRAVTGWHAVTQAAVDAFAEASGDRNPLHVDVAAAGDSPFGGTIAHGAWLLSAVPPWFAGVIELKGIGFGVLYGFERVRFPAALPVGSNVRMHVRIAAVDAVTGGSRVTSELSFECDRAPDKPVCVAQHIIAVYY